jgi:hypothetical protein
VVTLFPPALLSQELPTLRPMDEQLALFSGFIFFSYLVGFAGS